jgi:hypothetical protein
MGRSDKDAASDSCFVAVRGIGHRLLRAAAEGKQKPELTTVELVGRLSRRARANT